MRRSPADELNADESYYSTTYADVFGEDWTGPDRSEMKSVHVFGR